ncbi:uncharacterized protein J7T54_007898 [Emericellopsis cladophorae]|uniref:Uncharacterized protein n=1 Tax=Emericellopsis cladophorae TaxID=2686198 RepID=A0A9Q0BHJ1_9HYPO|nr:uncharacterized protein J7T54_007898 [Emericellopsis cladophorae]KAI6784805.1 hypothetical protein J7T54_007898 [Emericellopsis cladophorae]
MYPDNDLEMASGHRGYPQNSRRRPLIIQHDASERPRPTPVVYGVATWAQGLRRSGSHQSYARMSLAPPRQSRRPRGRSLHDPNGSIQGFQGPGPQGAFSAELQHQALGLWNFTGLLNQEQTASLGPQQGIWDTPPPAFKNSIEQSFQLRPPSQWPGPGPFSFSSDNSAHQYPFLMSDTCPTTLISCDDPIQDAQQAPLDMFGFQSPSYLASDMSSSGADRPEMGDTRMLGVGDDGAQFPMDPSHRSRQDPSVSPKDTQSRNVSVYTGKATCAPRALDPLSSHHDTGHVYSAEYQGFPGPTKDMLDFNRTLQVDKDSPSDKDRVTLWPRNIPLAPRQECQWIIPPRSLGSSRLPEQCRVKKIKCSFKNDPNVCDNCRPPLERRGRNQKPCVPADVVQLVKQGGLNLEGKLDPMAVMKPSSHMAALYASHRTDGVDANTGVSRLHIDPVPDTIHLPTLCRGIQRRISEGHHRLHVCIQPRANAPDETLYKIDLKGCLAWIQQLELGSTARSFRDLIDHDVPKFRNWRDWVSFSDGCKNINIKRVDVVHLVEGLLRCNEISQFQHFKIDGVSSGLDDIGIPLSRIVARGLELVVFERVQTTLNTQNGDTFTPELLRAIGKLTMFVMRRLSWPSVFAGCRTDAKAEEEFETRLNEICRRLHYHYGYIVQDRGVQPDSDVDSALVAGVEIVVAMTTESGHGDSVQQQRV